MRALPTKAQARLLKAFAEMSAMKGYPPTFAEIGAWTGLSSLATVHKHVHGLERRGYLRKADRRQHGAAYGLTNRAKNHLRATPCPYCAGTGCAA